MFSGGRGFESLKNKSHQQGANNELCYSISSMQGWRNEMEDAHCAFVEIPALEKWSFFGVFDGHGGTLCSEESSKRLLNEIVDQIRYRMNVLKLTRAEQLTDDEILHAIKDAFLIVDKKLRELEPIRSEQDHSGTTVVGALISPTTIYLMNCGDSRAIFVRDKYIEICTYDHKPTQLKERQRIQNAGGIVALSRVNGGLATSRGLGDFDYKSVPNFKPHEQFVSCEPDVFIAKRDRELDKYIILACDGIWDVVKNEDVMEFVSGRIGDPDQVNTDLIREINDKLLDHCFEKGSKDNMTIVTVFLKPSILRPSSSSLNRLTSPSVQQFAASTRPSSNRLSAR